MSVEQMGLVWKLDLDSNKKLVLLAYADHADDEGDRVYPSIARVAYKTGMSPRHVKRLSHELVSLGLMELVEEGGGRGNPNRYRLTLDNGDNLTPFSEWRKGDISDKRVTNGARKGDTLSPEPSITVSKENTPKGVDESVSQTNSSPDLNPGMFVGYLREELDGSDVPLLRNREDRYAAEFKRLMKKGVGADLIYKAADRIVERWCGDDHRKLTAEQALEDVVNGKPPVHASQSSRGFAADGSIYSDPEQRRRNEERRKAGYEWLLEQDDVEVPTDVLAAQNQRRLAEMRQSQES